jgi:hypothetical protein
LARSGARAWWPRASTLAGRISREEFSGRRNQDEGRLRSWKVQSVKAPRSFGSRTVLAPLR